MMSTHDVVEYVPAKIKLTAFDHLIALRTSLFSTSSHIVHILCVNVCSTATMSASVDSKHPATCSTVFSLVDDDVAMMWQIVASSVRYVILRTII